jgi:hypothetical protein
LVHIGTYIYSTNRRLIRRFNHDADTNTLLATYTRHLHNANPPTHSQRRPLLFRRNNRQVTLPPLLCTLLTSHDHSFPGLAIAYPALINNLFLTKRDMPIAQRLTVWNRGYDAGKRSIPLFALLSAGAYLGGAFVYPSSLSVGKGRRSAVVAALLHVSIGPITVSLTE